MSGPTPVTDQTTPTTSRPTRMLLAGTAVVLLLGMAAAFGVGGPGRAVLGDGLATGSDEAAPEGARSAASDVAGAGATAVAPEAAAEQPAAAEGAAPVTQESAGAAAAPPVPAPVDPWTVDVHAGLGAWVDIWDWSMWGSSGEPTVTVETIDALAAQGVRTIYIQTTRVDRPEAVVEQDRLVSLIDRAHEHGMFVVGWYLPEFTDVEDDWRRIEAAMALPIDGFALDIESQSELDVPVRTKRLLELSRRLRDLAGDRVLVANVLPPVQMEELAPSLWPGFPWAELGELYEVFMPMGYFTFREDGHHWRDAEAYTAENVRRIRERVGDPELPVHFIGGIADLTTVGDVQGMTRGAQATGAIGLSLYDVATTGTELWEPMQAWRDLG